MKKKCIITIVICAVVLFIANIIFACIFSQEGANIFTAISGWVSFLATVIVGRIAYRQGKRFKDEAETKERFVDIIIGRVEVTNSELPNSVMGRKCIPSYDQVGVYRFKLNIFSFLDNPVFDFKVISLKKNNATLCNYNNCQPIQPDGYGRNFLPNNSSAQIVAEIPKDDDFNGKYTLMLQFRNQYGDIYEKEVIADLANNFERKVKSFTQAETHLIKMNPKNGQA